MYNITVKEEYLRDCKYEDTTIEVIRGIFNTTELAEERAGKDLCFFTRPQIIDMLKGFNSKAPNRLKVACVYLADYYNWCLNTKHLVSDATNYYHYTLSDDMISMVISKADLQGKYFNKQDLLKYLDKIVDVSNKFIAYAVFCGIRGDDYSELINMKMSDYNPETKKVKLISGREVPVDDLLYKLMVQTDAAQDYFPYGEAALVESTFGTSGNQYVNTGLILRPCRVGEEGVPIKRQTMVKRLQAIKDQCGNSFVSISTLYKNGLINYIKERYEAQGVDLETAILGLKKVREYTHDIETQKYIEEFGAGVTARMLRKEIKDYLEFLK